jgi:Mg-chelatase subunit ChlI
LFLIATMKCNNRYNSQSICCYALILQVVALLMIIVLLELTIPCVDAFAGLHGHTFSQQGASRHYFAQHASTKKGTTTTRRVPQQTNIQTTVVLYKPTSHEEEVIGCHSAAGVDELLLHQRKLPKDNDTSSKTYTIAERKFPFSMIVGQDELKEAAIIAASNPLVSGILIGGRHGTGKSVMARAIHQLLPKEIKRVKGSSYNIDPSGIGGLDSLLLQDLTKKGMALSDLDTEYVQTPFVQVPLNVMEDSLCGSVDIEKSMKLGETVFAPGLLAKAHRGILYIDDIHLLDADILSMLFDVLSDGWVTVEREGIR